MTQTDGSSNLSDVWTRVSNGIERIYQIQEMSPKDYMELYT